MMLTMQRFHVLGILKGGRLWLPCNSFMYKELKDVPWGVYAPGKRLERAMLHELLFSEA